MALVDTDAAARTIANLPVSTISVRMRAITTTCTRGDVGTTPGTRGLSSA
jgi:hypothetical protein